MRRTLASSVAALLLCFCRSTPPASVQPVAAPPSLTVADQLLEHGRANYAAGKYAEAVEDLKAASDAYLNAQQMQAYVNSGHFESLPKFETALVYLTLSYAKLGRDADAHQQVDRLLAAESIAPTFTSLSLGPDTSEFTQVAQRIAPALQLPGQPAPAPTQIAQAQPQPAPVPQPVPAPQPAPVTQPAPAPVAPAPVPAPAPAPAPLPAPQPAPVVQTASATTSLGSLRDADALAASGRLDEANALYLRAVTAPNASRDMLAAAATGLYRTGDYADAVRAFQRLGTLLRGEEDLRFYHAVSLFEIGRYAESKKELDCALPYLQITDNVARYRMKIEQMQAHPTM